MSVYVTKMLWPLLNPANLVLTLLLFGALLRFVPGWRGAGRGILLAMTAVIAVAAVLPLGNWAVRPLENYFPRPVLPAQVSGIILLGGAENVALTAEHRMPQVNGAAERYFAFAELAARYPGARLVFSGSGLRTWQDQAMNEALVAEGLMRQIGLPPERVTFEREARNTIENAVNTRRMVKPGAGETWILITSARHMPRAVNSFRAADWPVLPWPVDYATSAVSEFRFNPLGGLQGLNLATQEWAGLVAYRLLGHTRSLLPER